MAGNSISIKFGDNRVSLEIGGLIASGGMGSVYRGKILGPGQYEKPVAIKQIKTQFSNDAGYRERFFTEARLGASLSHPNVVQTILYGEDSTGALYLVMELIEWPTLRSIMDRHIDEGKLLPIDAVKRLLFEIAETLAAMHGEQGLGNLAPSVIHGDISPENILVDSSLRIKILDFGISLSSKNSISDKQPGKIEYTAPEIIQGKAPSASGDIYSLGVLAFEMLCGHLPFERARREPSARTLAWNTNRELPQELMLLVSSMLAGDPNERPDSAKKISKAIGVPAPQLNSIGQRNTVPDVRYGERQATHLPKRSLLLVCLGLCLVAGIALYTFAKRTKLGNSPSPPSLTLHAGEQWIDLGPGKKTERLTDFQLELGKRLHPSACHDACETSLGTISLLLADKALSDETFTKMGISPKLFASSINDLSRALNENSALLSSACGASPTCAAVLDSAPWLERTSGEIQNTLIQKGSITVSDFRKIATRLDAGGHERKRIERAVAQISKTPLEIQTASKRLNSKLYSVSSIAGVDLIEAAFTAAGTISNCEQIGDEFFAKKLDPLGEARGSRPETLKPKLSAVILPAGHLFNVTNSSKGELVFGWSLPEPPSASSVFSRGICFYSREGAALKAVLHWIPSISKNGKAGE